MSRRKPVRALLIAAAATTALLGMSGIPASANPTLGNCITQEFPAIQASQSAVRTSGLFNNSATPSSNQVSSNFTLHDFQNAAYHQGSARKVTLTAATPIGGTVLTASAGNFTIADVNHPVSALSGTNTPVVPARAFIASQTATTATMNVAAAVAIPIGTVVLIDNDTARTVKDAVFNGTSTVTSATARFLAADVGKTISATNIGEYKTITAVASLTSATMSATAVTGTAQVVSIGGSTSVRSTRSVIDGTQNTTTITSATAAFNSSDIGNAVFGTGIPVGARITATPSATTATVTPLMTANATPHNIVIGIPSVTAPTNGSTGLSLGTILDLNPALVAGQNACTLNKPEGLSINGTWQNPGSFVTSVTPSFNVQPSGQTIAQILFRTSVITFSAWIIQVPTDVTKPVPHYDVAFPSLPTAIAACPAPNAVNIASSFQIPAGTSYQSSLPTGVGRPSSAQFRYLGPNGGVSASTTAVFKSNVATVPKNWSFTSTCVMAALPVSNFQCGN